jgi:hypothetical protein
MNGMSSMNGMNRLQAWWGDLGGKAGILFCGGGFVALFLGWNGAASYDDVPAQLPYLLSGGLVGLSLIVIGGALLVVDGNRRSVEDLRASVEELRAAVEAMAAPATNGHRPVATTTGLVVAGASSYHRPSCHLVEGRDDARLLTVEEAAADLAPCRICKPASVLGAPSRT